jgi:hypothetical protein
VISTFEHELARRGAAPLGIPTISRRLSILTQREIDDLYGLPLFTEEDRQLYFDLSAAEEVRVRAMHTASARAHFVLQLGYFKAKRQFFSYPYHAVQEDLRYILGRHFPGRAPATINQLSKPTRLEQQQIILNLFNYTRCGKAAKHDLEHKARRVAMRSMQPIYILREVLQYLATRRIMAPGYTVLQDLVSRAVTRERDRITHLLEQAITPESRSRYKPCSSPTKGSTSSPY